MDFKQQQPAAQSSLYPKQTTITDQQILPCKRIVISQTYYIELPGDENSHAHIYPRLSQQPPARNRYVAEKASMVNPRLCMLNPGVSRVSRYHQPPIYMYDSCVCRASLLCVYVVILHEHFAFRIRILFRSHLRSRYLALFYLSLFFLSFLHLNFATFVSSIHPRALPLYSFIHSFNPS